MRILFCLVALAFCALLAPVAHASHHANVLQVRIRAPHQSLAIVQPVFQAQVYQAPSQILQLNTGHCQQQQQLLLSSTSYAPQFLQLNAHGHRANVLQLNVGHGGHILQVRDRRGPVERLLDNVFRR